MSIQQDYFSVDTEARCASLKADWHELCRRYLPVRVEGSIWRFSREQLPGDPVQGWKLHIPATVLTAPCVLESVGAFLQEHGVLYKAPGSLHEVDKINCGIYYGYSQVGKFLTIYPQTDDEAVLLAEGLYLLTRGMNAPTVPFDLKYREDGCIYYRYGAFRFLEIEDSSGKRTYAIRAPDGNLVPDVRESAAHPKWAADPFLVGRARQLRTPAPTPLQTTFKAFRALTQRGKGGVYQALDLSATPPRVCILKEGRRDGEVGWDGRDGVWRVEHERRVLDSLRASGIDVPRVYSSFRAEKNYYLAIEFVEGKDFNSCLSRRRRRLPVPVALRRGVELARLLSRIHAAGWVWRDCKPNNIIITKDGKLRPLDFEGACEVSRPDPLPWGTPSFTPPEVDDAFRGQSRLPEDLYALGAIVYLLLAGYTPDAAEFVPLKKLRKGVPEAACALIAELLDREPARRPDAQTAACILEAALLSQTPVRDQGLTLTRRIRSANRCSERRSSYKGSILR
jgi:serine/threonine protein kinase